MTNLKIDSREQKRIETAKDYFTPFADIEKVTVEQLEVGDYIFTNKGLTCGFEYKTSTDFLSSILNKRVFKECIGLRETIDYPFLIVEGNIPYAKNKLYYSAQQTITNDQIQGAIYRLRCILPVIIVKNPLVPDDKKDDDLETLCFHEMYNQQKKAVDGKTPYYKELCADKHKNPAISLLMLINGVSLKLAERIADTLELKNQKDVLELTVEDLQKVHKIGEKKSERIIRQIKGDFQ